MNARLESEGTAGTTSAPGPLQGRFTSDVHLADELFASFVHSSHAHALIDRIDTSAALALPGVVAALTGDDLDSPKFGRALQDYPVLADGRVLFVGQPIAVVAAEDPLTARRAALMVDVTYRDLESALDPNAHDHPATPDLHPDYEVYAGAPLGQRAKNVQGSVSLDVGDTEKVMKECDQQYRHRFQWSRSHAAPMEPHACVVSATETIEVYSTHKEPFKLQRDLARMAGLDKKAIVVLPIRLGGDFGSKATSLIEGACMFLSQATGRPVRSSLSYVEELNSTSARHAGEISLRSGLRQGRIEAVELEALLDGGAFAAMKPQSNLIPHVDGVLSWLDVPNRRVRAVAVYTNTLPAGQVRSPGEFQATFAGESHVDMIARDCAEDPLEFRLNRVSNDRYRAILDELSSKVAAWRVQQNGEGTGIGVSLFERGTGTGHSTVEVKATRSGVILFTSVVDQGGGAFEAMRALAAKELHVDIERVHVEPVDTAANLEDSGTGASRVTALAGQACVAACRALVDSLGGLPDGPRGNWIEIRLGELDVYELSDRAHVRRERGASPPGVTRAGLAVEVQVETDSGAVSVRKAFLVVDSGYVVNRRGYLGQLEGGFVYGLSQAIYEELAVEDGVVTTATLGDYRLATIGDVPQLEIRLLEPSEPDRPELIRGIGEVANLGVAPAIANGIADAVGVRITSLPITAEKVWRALQREGFAAYQRNGEI